MLRLTATPPDSRSDRFAGSPIATMQYGGGGLVGSYRPNLLALLQTQLLSVVSIGNEQATIAIESAGAVTSVAIDGFTYTLSTGANEPSTFSWNPDAGTITLNLAAGHQPTVGAIAVVHSLGDRAEGQAIPTGEVLDPAPDWFADWNVQGGFRWNRNFEDQPSGSFSFVTIAANESDVRSRLQNGTKLIAYGIGFSVSSLSVTRLSPRSYPGNYIQVEVSLTGYWVKELIKPVKLKRSLTVTTSGGTGFGSTYTQPQNISAIAAAAGAKYSGLAIDMNVSANISDAERTTLGNEIENRAIAVNGFAFYSEASAVQVREWRKTRLHVLSSGDLLSPVQVAIGGSRAHFSAQQQDNLLTDEYRNTLLTLDRDAQQKDYQQNQSRWIEDGDEFCESPPQEFFALTQASRLTLESLSNNHDAGGVTKEKTRTLYRGSNVMKVVKQKFGFAYRGIDVYLYSVTQATPDSEPSLNWYKYNPATNPTQWWGLVEESIESYNYDPTEGYLLSVSVTTRRRSRLKQEQDARETILAETTPTVYANGVLVKNGANLRKAYQFNQTTETDTTSHTLASYLGLYPDVQRPKDNQDWVEPKYAAATTRTSAQTVQGGIIEPSKPAPLAGKAFSETHRAIVNYPYRGIAEADWDKEQEMFTTKAQTKNQQGENLKDSLKIGHRTENLGRPSTHTRIEPIKPPAPPIVRAASQQKPVRTLLNTPNNGLTAIDPQEGSVSFPGVIDYDKGRECAQTKVSIANTKNVETWKFSVPHYVGKHYQEGDRLSLMGKLLVIFSLEEELKIQQGAVSELMLQQGYARTLITSEGISISAGLFLDPPVTLTYA